MENAPYMHTYTQPHLTDKARDVSKHSLFHILTYPHFIPTESSFITICTQRNLWALAPLDCKINFYLDDSL